MFGLVQIVLIGQNVMGIVKEENKMEMNLCRCQELFDELAYTNRLNPYLLDQVDFVERVEMFVQWAKEFTDIIKINANNPNWNWIDESEVFFVNKIESKFKERDYYE